MRISSVLFVVAATLAVVGTGCGERCRRGREEIQAPMQRLEAFLNLNPTGDQLRAQCSALTADLARIPSGAQMVRDTAAEYFTNSYSYCAQYATGYRTECSHSWQFGRYGRWRPGYGGDWCWNEPYQYCASWGYNVVRRPGYENAVELSRVLDQSYAMFNSMCSDALAGRGDEAVRRAAELRDYQAREVRPRGLTIISQACGS